MQPGDRLVCAFVNALGVSDTFTEWPLHITIVPWFRVDMDSGKLAAELSAAYVGGKPFSVSVQGEEMFGYKNRKAVNLVSSLLLPKLEGQTRRLLYTHHAWIVDESDHTRHGYRSHVTVQKDARVQEGDSFKCDRLYIVSQKGGFKQVDDQILL